MSVIGTSRRRWIPRILAILAAIAPLLFLSPGAAADSIVMFTASTDNTQDANGTGGISFPNINDPTNPNFQNLNLPGISNGVMLSPGSGGFSVSPVGPLDGVTYGPYGFGNNAGGSTGWVTSSYTFAAAGQYQIVWEVANLLGSQGYDALATDNITLNGTRLFDFRPGLPTGFNGLGSTGTSTGVTNLNPSGGDSAFAWMDVNPFSSNPGVTPYFDTSGDVYSASQLYSSMITVKAGDTISIDIAFMTTGGIVPDYAAVALQSVPEPSGLVLAASGLIVAAGYAAMRRRARLTCA